MNLDEIKQLIRMAQVLRVRANNLSVDLRRMPKPQPEQSDKVAQAAELARDVETKLAQVRAFFD